MTNRALCRKGIAPLGLTVAILAAPSPARAECVSWEDVMLYLVIDASPSMLDAVGGTTKYQLASSFGVSVIDGLNGTGHLERAGAMAFCQYVPAAEILVQSSIGNVRTWVASLPAAGTCDGTHVYDAIYVGAVLVDTWTASHYPVLVVLSDGEDTGSVYSAADAATALASTTAVTELIYIGAGASPFPPIAASAGSHVRARTSSPASLNALVADVVDRTCRNHRPNASFTRSPAGHLDLGEPGFTMSFDGSPSSDQESSDGSLSFSWRFTRPDGTAVNASGINTSRTFADGDIGTWQVRLTVTDPQGSSDDDSASFEVRGSPPDITVSGPAAIDVLETLSVSVSPTDDIDGGGEFLWTWEVLDAPTAAVIQPPGPIPPWTTATVSFVTTETDITQVGPDLIGQWHFRVTAEDNEGDTDSDEIVVHVRNLPPEVVVTGEHQVSDWEPIYIDASATADPDGGTVDFAWDLVQVPANAGIPVQNDFAVGEIFDYAGDPGTWIARLRATDNEGEEVEQEWTVLVDAPPEAAITGPTVVGSLTPFELSSVDSVDPDSPCPGEIDGCHLTDGRPATVSGAIVSRTWTLLEVPVEHFGEFVPGAVSELGIDGYGTILSIPGGTLKVGTWVFQVEVVDAEGNSDIATHSITIIPENGHPFAIAAGPWVYQTDASHILSSAVVLDGHYSFDADNLLVGDPFAFGMGILTYTWAPVMKPPACPSGGGASGALITVFPAGTVLPVECYGWWRFGLTVADDDAPQKTGTTTQDFIISDCNGMVCIESPTGDNPELVAFSDQTDVTIAYYLNSALYGTPFCASGGCYAALSLYHESDAIHPVYQAWDPNPIAPPGTNQQFFKWNGYIQDFTGSLVRPLDGRYTTRIEILNVGFAPGLYEAEEVENIWVEVAEPQIVPTSDAWLSLNAARAGTDTLSVDWSVSGTIPVTEINWRVYVEGEALPIFSGNEPGAGAGTVVWSGETAPDIYLEPGYYEIEVEAVGAPGILGTSDRHRFAAYSIDLEIDTLPEEDEEAPGAFLEVGPDLVDVVVRLEPDGLDGLVTLVEDGTNVLGPPGIDWAAGVALPAMAAYPEAIQQLTVPTASAPEVVLRARYTPPLAPPQKQAEDTVKINPVELDLTARCSADEREHTTGVFVQRRQGPAGPVSVGTERFMMRTLKVTASHELDGVTLELHVGDAADVAVFVPPTPGAVPVQVAMPHTFPAALYDADGKLEVDVLVRGLRFTAADVVLRLALRKDGADFITDDVKLRIGDMPLFAGELYAAGVPHWYTRRTLNQGAAVQIAVDPSLHDERRTLRGFVYVVPRRTAADWAADATLADATGGAETITISDFPGTLTDNVHVVWPAATAVSPGSAYEVVIDFGDCSAGAVTDGRLDPDDLVLPLDPAPPSLVVLPDLGVAGPLATSVVEYGADFEDGDNGTDCTPAAENGAGAPCTPNPAGVLPPAAAPPHCALDEVCLETDGDGVPHCTAVPRVAAACAAGEACVNTDNDEDAHCRQAPQLIDMPLGYDGLATQPVLGQFRLRGRIVHPAPLGPGLLPLVLLAHGNHTPKIIRLTAVGASTGRRWFDLDAAAPGITSDQNYRGHTYLQQHLASHGVVTVSIDLDELVGASDIGYPDVAGGSGILLRGWLVLKNLEASLAHPALVGHIDPAQIYLLGHSRGGEAVVAANYILGDIPNRGPASVVPGTPPNLTAPGLAGVSPRSIISISPTTAAPVSLAAGVLPYLLIYGTADGDVNGFTPGVRPFELLDRAQGVHAGLVIRGANHNFFNTSWVQDDARPRVPNASPPPAEVEVPLGIDLRTRPEQEAFARAYVLAWLRFNQGLAGYDAYFATSPSRLRPLGVGAFAIHGQSRRATGAFTPIDDFEDALGGASTSAGTAFAATVTIAAENVLRDGDVSVGLPADILDRFVQDTRGLLFDWGAAAEMSFELPLAARDLRGVRSLAMRLAQQPGHTLTTTAAGVRTFTIALVDGAGRTVSIPAAFETELAPIYESTLASGVDTAVAPMAVFGIETTTAIFETVRVDVDRFVVDGASFDLNDVRQIVVRFATPPGGRLAIDDVNVEP